MCRGISAAKNGAVAVFIWHAVRGGAPLLREVNTNEKPKSTGSPSINTGGGAYIGGNVNAGGDVVGRDQHKAVSIQQGATLEEFTKLLAELRQRLLETNLGQDTANVIDADVQVLEEQINKPEPKRAIVQAKLKSITEILKNVDSAAGAVEGTVGKAVSLGQRLGKIAAVLFS